MFHLFQRVVYFGINSISRFSLLFWRYFFNLYNVLYSRWKSIPFRELNVIICGTIMKYLDSWSGLKLGFKKSCVVLSLTKRRSKLYSLYTCSMDFFRLLALVFGAYEYADTRVILSEVDFRRSDYIACGFEYEIDTSNRIYSVRSVLVRVFRIISMST